MNFQFFAPVKIIFGAGTSSELVSQARSLGNKALVLTGSKPERYQKLIDSLQNSDLSPVFAKVAGEPSTSSLEIIVELARKQGCDMVISIGGGSVIDSGKAAAAFLTNFGDMYDYLEVVGQGKPLHNSPAAHIALPTSAGTGAEVTANAVLEAEKEQVKVSLRSPMLFANIAIVDPNLTLPLPANITAATGMDALTQLIEAFVSRKANPMTNAWCRQGLICAARSLKTACLHGDDIQARTDMSLAALLSGLALANAKLGAVHGLAAPLGAAIHAPHGAICAALLPTVMDINIQKLTVKPNRSWEAFVEIAEILTGSKSAIPQDGLAWVQDLCAELKIKGLKSLGLKTENLADIAAKGAKASSMQGNPVLLDEQGLINILQSSM